MYGILAGIVRGSSCRRGTPRRTIRRTNERAQARPTRRPRPAAEASRRKNAELDAVDAPSLRDDIPPFRAGDTLKVHVKVIEGNRSRIQVFQGVVIARRGHGVSSTFTIRKVSFGVGVERTFPVHAPTIDHIEVVTKGDVRRAKLYYLRERHGKAAKIKEHRSGKAE